VAGASLRGVPVTIARIGYSGELGYEILVPAPAAPDLWRLARRAGRDTELRPCGGIALQGLRIEGGSLMTRADFDDTVTPLEAGSLDSSGSARASSSEAVLAITEPCPRLTGLRARGDTVMPRGTAVKDRQGRIVGRVSQRLSLPHLRLRARAGLCGTSRG
jgi:aminomethyltransferase